MDAEFNTAILHRIPHSGLVQAHIRTDDTDVTASRLSLVEETGVPGENHRQQWVEETRVPGENHRQQWVKTKTPQPRPAD